MAEYQGPSIDQLNDWSQSLDALPFSLDDVKWLTAWKREGASSASITLSASATGGVSIFAAGSAAAEVSASATGLRTVYAAGATAIEVNAEGSAYRTRIGRGAAVIEVSGTASGAVSVVGAGSAAMSLTSSARAGVAWAGASWAMGEVLGTVAARIRGEEWGAEADETTSWSDESATGAVWTVITSEASAWVPR